VHFNEEVEVQIVESPAVEVLEVSEVGLLQLMCAKRCSSSAFNCVVICVHIRPQEPWKPSLTLDTIEDPA